MQKHFYNLLFFFRSSTVFNPYDIILTILLADATRSERKMVEVKERETEFLSLFRRVSFFESLRWFWFDLPRSAIRLSSFFRLSVERRVEGWGGNSVWLKLASLVSSCFQCGNGFPPSIHYRVTVAIYLFNNLQPTARRFFSIFSPFFSASVRWLCDHFIRILDFSSPFFFKSIFLKNVVFPFLLQIGKKERKKQSDILLVCNDFIFLFHLSLFQNVVILCV